MRRILALFFFWGTTAAQASTGLASIDFTDGSGRPAQLEVRLSRPEAPAPSGKRPAVVILHHGGGWEAQTTRQYADLLNANGYVTAEPVLFKSRPVGSHVMVPMVFATLRHLASSPDVDPGKIGVIGLSAGAMQAIYGITDWATNKYGGGQRFATAMAFYPGCWVLKKYYLNDLGRWKNPNYPEDFLKKFTGVPLTIMAAGKDDYDSQKATMCAEAAALMPDERQKALTQVHLFESASHGWDHGHTYSFQDPMACEGRGCNNTNRSDPQTTDAAKTLLLKRLGEELQRR